MRVTNKQTSLPMRRAQKLAPPRRKNTGSPLAGKRIWKALGKSIIADDRVPAIGIDGKARTPTSQVRECTPDQPKARRGQVDDVDGNPFGRMLSIVCFEIPRLGRVQRELE